MDIHGNAVTVPVTAQAGCIQYYPLSEKKSTDSCLKEHQKAKGAGL
jgi:hypothetical protein